MKAPIIKTLIFFGLLSLSLGTFAQDAPPPPPSHGNGTNSDPGGGAPIGGGLGILLAMGAAYGGKKLYNTRKERLEE